MTFRIRAILKSIHKFEDRFDSQAERFVFHHPCLAFAAMFIGVPVFVLAAVTISTVVLTLPVALLCGWL